MPRVRLDGGVIGSLNIPSTTSASGMWTVKDNEEYTRRGLWPSQSYPVGSINAIMLVVAGGGGSGYDVGGGGGAGGLIYLSNLPMATSNYTITVGAGGAGGASSGLNGANGSNSSISGAVNYTAIGGGGGGNQGTPGYAGGSGGGTGGVGSGGPFSGGISIQNSTFGYGVGNTGGSAVGSTPNFVAGGGGGANTAGGAASGTTAGAGGNGLAYNFANGTSVYYAGGGGGGLVSGSAGSGGLGGGGAGVASAGSTTGYAGSQGTGGGAGGGGHLSVGVNGGSGTVILSYPLPQQWTGGTVTNNNGTNVVHTFTSSGTMTALATPIDTYQPYNTLLLHADGTSGANNSVFKDSSGTVYDSTSIPFPNTFSNYINGTNTYFTTPTANSNLFEMGSNDFTVELWFYALANVDGGLVYKGQYQVSGSNTWLPGFGIRRISATQLRFTFNTTTNVATEKNYDYTTTTNLNQWYHVAMVVSGGVGYAYVNGTLINAGGLSGIGAIGTSSTPISVGIFPYVSGNRFFNGYISNLRIVTGAVYTGSSFNVPTSSLTSIANTQLLTCQSLTIIDNSPNALTLTNNGPTTVVIPSTGITKTGTPTQGTFSPFATTGWSTYHPSAADYYSFPSLASMVIGASGSCTLECWAYFTAIPATGSYIFSKDGKSGTNVSEYAFQFSNGSGLLVLTVGDATGAASQQAINFGTITTGTWYHIAASRVGTTWYLFLNGSLVNSGGTAQTVTPVTGSRSFYIGGQQSGGGSLNGAYISNLRINIGQALYTSSFNVPIAALTNIANTVVLTAQNNKFIENISNGVITTAGTPQVQPFSPFSPTSAYSNTVVGGSIYFNGSTDYISMPSSSAFNFGSNNFTVEYWVNYDAAGGTQSTMGTGNSSGSTGWLIYDSGSSVAFYYGNGTSQINGLALTYTHIPKQWTHFAFVRSGSTIYGFINGVLINSASLSATISNSTNNFIVGVNATNLSNYFSGYISNARVINGIAQYTSAFTPPAAPFTSASAANTTLLLNATNAGIIDSSQKKQLTTYGTAAISNVKSQFGGSSLLLNGSTDYLTFTNSIVMGTQAYTMECWFYLNSTSFSNFYPFIGTSTNSTSALNIRISNTTVIRVDANNSSGTDFTLPVTLTTGVWYHLAVTRDAAGNCNVWLNGVRSTSGNQTVSTNYTGTTDTIGYVQGTFSGFFNGYIDEFRLTQGYARYNANFTPQTTAFINT